MRMPQKLQATKCYEKHSVDAGRQFHSFWTLSLSLMHDRPVLSRSFAVLAATYPAGSVVRRS
jgi:hypothetical protein